MTVVSSPVSLASVNDASCLTVTGSFITRYSTWIVVGAALRGRPAWKSISRRHNIATVRLTRDSISPITPGGHGGAPLPHAFWGGAAGFSLPAGGVFSRG